MIGLKVKDMESNEIPEGLKGKEQYYCADCGVQGGKEDSRCENCHCKVYIIKYLQNDVISAFAQEKAKLENLENEKLFLIHEKNKDDILNTENLNGFIKEISQLKAENEKLKIERFSVVRNIATQDTNKLFDEIEKIPRFKIANSKQEFIMLNHVEKIIRKARR